MYLLLQVRDEFISSWFRHWGIRSSVVSLGEEPVSPKSNDNTVANIATILSPSHDHLPNLFDMHRIFCPNVTLCPNSSFSKAL